ncbi:MAG TPA: ATP-dependent DNA helicase RecQ, partial [Longimicrobiaceae bacterium]|nr:ATP-dependent DNA helicase RecQ [Longimicrobiaceae bacterium]
MNAPAASLDLEQILRERFGLSSFRPGQERVISALLEQGGALAVFPTGGGKSLCYQLPALLLEGVTVVISPLIALMKDQIDFLRSRGIEAARLDSSLSLEEAREVERGLRDGSLRLLYVAPERFNNERFLQQLGRARIALFAVDEAHCISEWGHNFRPDYLKLADTARTLGAERVLALTATATPPVVEDICRSFRISPEAAVVTGFHRPNLFLRTTPVVASRRDSALLERLRSRPPGPGIVYVTLQRTAERVAETLAAAGIPARAYHAGMQDEERTAVQEWWKTSDRAVVVATIAFGMGIDKADVRYVYHYNLPKSLESYSQEIGRAGRDGEPSVVEMLGGPEDVATLENFAYGDTPTPESLRGVLEEILTQEAEFDVNLIGLANRHDIRPLVLRTALTYLELLSVLRQGTPFYAAYRVRPSLPLEEIAANFAGERARFVERIFAQAKKGREWYTVNAEEAAEALGEERGRVVRALDYLAEQGWVELQVTDARQRFTRLIEAPDVEALATELAERFTRREGQEIRRVRHIVRLITYPGCQTNALLRYFGEQRTEPCGHCTFCEGGRPTEFPPEKQQPPIDTALDVEAFRALCESAPEALGHPRQQARFL